jgi:hypothetical protein
MVQGLQGRLSQILQVPTVLEFEGPEKQKGQRRGGYPGWLGRFHCVLIRTGPCLAMLINMPPLAKMAAI